MAGCRLPVEKKRDETLKKKRRGKKSEEILRRYHVRLTQRGLAPGLAISHSPQKEKRSRAKDVLLPRHALSRALTLNPLLCFALLSFPFLFFVVVFSLLDFISAALARTLVFCAWISQRPATKGVERAFRLTGTRSTALDRCFTPRRPWTTLLKDDAGSLARLLRLGLPLRR
ncbi:hypothetical protein DTO021D3_466 [Paecilomyces variotii]|nr:hypothetical protein DTO032I3_375 [Paecilomyces variotii]KAJ9283129.1 hypothetical protein DTO021D3_466 [Paecilomyces variotii]KAJ9346770.1 hypothetical protein DTO027B6_337 [Paecilomyces variotii]KAJ9393682.1 hypothetical protein DTO032I4_453 [Paecilomyces variotii]